MSAELALQRLVEYLDAQELKDQVVRETLEMLGQTIAQRDAELAEIRDGLLALSNRIESVGRICSQRAELLV